MAFRKLGDRRRDLPRAEHDGHVDPQQPARLDALARDRGVGGLHVGEDELGGFQIASSGLGDGQPPRGPVEQFCAEPGLERGNMLGHHGLRQADGPGRARQAADRRHLGEDFQAGQPVEH